MKRLKIIKNIELRKNNSIITINLNEKIKNSKEKKRDLEKIYRYYFSKNKIKEKLIYQKISLMKKNLNKKHNEEKTNFRIDFYRKYPSESNYNNELSNFLKEINKNKYKVDNVTNEDKNYNDIKNEFLNKKHEEYIQKMGLEYEKELNKLNEKFKQENDEQKSIIRRLILNHKISEMEKQDVKKNTIYNRKNNKNEYFNLSQDNIQSYFYKNNNQKDNKDNNNKLCSKIFKFGGIGSPYKTILI